MSNAEMHCLLAKLLEQMRSNYLLECIAIEGIT